MIKRNLSALPVTRTSDFQRRAIIAPVVSIACAALVIYSHAIYVYPVYGYLGIPYVPLNIAQYVGVFLFVILTSLMLPPRLQQTSDLGVWIIYYFCLLPSITMAPTLGVLSNAYVFILQISLSAGFLFIVLLSRPTRSYASIVRIDRSAFWAFILLSFLVFNSWILFENFGNMRLVGLGNVYVQRFAGGETVKSSGYAMGIAAGSLNIFMMTYGLIHKRRALLILGVIGQVLIYSVQAQKFVFLSILYVPGIYILLGGPRFGFPSASRLIWRVGALAITLLAIGIGLVFLRSSTELSIVGNVRSILLMRMFGLPGAMTTQYAHFFSEHPLTYMTHVGFGKFIWPSPYQREVSIEIGSFLAKSHVGMNANANFFAYDGIASFGLWGPAVAGIVVGLFFRLLNWVGYDQSRALFPLCSSGLFFSLTESSAFTTMVTGGGFFLVVILYLYRCSHSPTNSQGGRPLNTLAGPSRTRGSF